MKATCQLMSFVEWRRYNRGRVMKRKRKVLTIEEKLDICRLLATGTSYTIISERYGIG